MLAGVAGYMAGLPVLIGVVVAALALQALVKFVMRGGAGAPTEPAVPENKVLELVAGTSGWTLVLVVARATVWAPLVEETIFRGALFRHLRARRAGVVGVGASVLVAALAFGLAHAYVWIGVVAVTTLGAVFAVMREWRGSLIAPMTAHCLHNSVAMALGSCRGRPAAPAGPARRCSRR
jgi:membrane protease YdiL (CAAX protease family)